LTLYQEDASGFGIEFALPFFSFFFFFSFSFFLFLIPLPLVLDFGPRVWGPELSAKFNGNPANFDLIFGLGFAEALSCVAIYLIACFGSHQLRDTVVAVSTARFVRLILVQYFSHPEMAISGYYPIIGFLVFGV
jgi:hypothetical protein